MLAARVFADILIAASPAIENYEKVYDPVKDRVKQLPDKIKSMRGQNDRGDDYSDDDYYDQPKRRSSRREPRRSRGDERWVEESYERKVSGRARSAGRDGAYGGGGRGLDRERRRKSYPALDFVGSPSHHCRSKVLFRFRILPIPSTQRPAPQVAW